MGNDFRKAWDAIPTGLKNVFFGALTVIGTFADELPGFIRLGLVVGGLVAMALASGGAAWLLVRGRKTLGLPPAPKTMEGALFLSCENSNAGIKFPKSRRLELISCPPTATGVGSSFRIEHPYLEAYDPFMDGTKRRTARIVVTNYTKEALRDVVIDFTVEAYAWVKNGPSASMGELKATETITRIISKIDPGADNHEAIGVFNRGEDFFRVIPSSRAMARRMSASEAEAVAIEFDHFFQASVHPYEAESKGVTVESLSPQSLQDTEEGKSQ